MHEKNNHDDKLSENQPKSSTGGNNLLHLEEIFFSPRYLFPIVIVLYTLLTIIFTYPVAFSPDSVPGHGDVTFYLWDLWWYKYAVLHFTTPYWTPLLFYPAGLSLAFSTITPFNGFISVPLQLIFGLVPTYNLIWLSSFVIAGCGTFSLVRYLTNDNKASFISGLIFMFSPYHFAHALGHLSLISLGWIPFYILYLLKTIREENSKNSIFAAVFLLIIGLNDYTYLFYALVFTGILLLFFLIAERKRVTDKKILLRLFTLFGLFGIGFVPFVFPMIYELITTSSNSLGFYGFSIYSSDIMGFFVPSTLHPLFGDIVAPIYLNFTGNIAENTIFAGYTVMFLGCIALVKIKTREIQFWFLATIIFVMLSLGPVLHFNGIVTGTIDGMKYVIALPYAIIMKLPVLSMARAPARWDVMVMLSLAVLAGYGLTTIFNKYQDRKFPMEKILAGIFSFLILFEFLTIPFPMEKIEIPEVYHLIEQDKGNFAIIEIPGFDHPEYMYFQTLHGKAMITGYTHIPEASWKFIQNTPFIFNLLMLNQDPPQKMVPQKDILNQDNTMIGSSLLNYYNIKYIIIHKTDLTSEQNTYISAFMSSSFNPDTIVYNNTHYILYKVPDQSNSTFMALDSKWSNRELWDGTPTRWITDNQNLLIYSGDDQTSTLSFRISGFYRPRRVIVSKQGVDIVNVLSSPEFTTVSIPVSLNKGENIFQFRVPDGCEKPNSHPELNNEDTRCLSVAIQNISLER